jgi:hypothetical protein
MGCRLYRGESEPGASRPAAMREYDMTFYLPGGPFLFHLERWRQEDSIFATVPTYIDPSWPETVIGARLTNLSTGESSCLVTGGDSGEYPGLAEEVRRRCRPRGPSNSGA